MTIKYRLLNSTPISLDHVEPFLIHDKAHWRKQFDLVMKQLQMFEKDIPNIYPTGFERRTNAWWIDLAKRWNRPLITYFTFFSPPHYPKYTCMYARVRFLDEPMPPSLKSRIKSWFRKITK